MARPKVLKEDTVRVGFHLEQSINDFLNAHAEKKGIKVSEVLRDAAADYAQKLKEENEILSMKGQKVLKAAIEAYQAASKNILQLKNFPQLNRYIYFAYLAHDLLFPWESDPEQLAERLKGKDPEIIRRLLTLRLRLAREYLAFDAWESNWAEEMQKKQQIQTASLEFVRMHQSQIEEWSKKPHDQEKGRDRKRKDETKTKGK